MQRNMNKTKLCVVLLFTIIVSTCFADMNYTLVLGESEFVGQSIIEVAAGDSFSVAITSDGTVRSWGANTYGQLGREGETETPSVIPSLSNVVKVEAGKNFCLALTSQGNVYAWGRNNYGQLGDKTNTNSTLPKLVLTQDGTLSDIVGIAAGDEHCLAVDNTGAVWAWGNGLNGRLGDGTQLSKNYAVKISGLMNIQSVVAGSKHSVALKNDGTVWSWGYGGYGQLGNGLTTNSTVPSLLMG